MKTKTEEPTYELLTDKISVDMVRDTANKLFTELATNVRPSYTIDDKIGNNSDIYRLVERMVKRQCPTYKGNLTRYIRESIDLVIGNETKIKDMLLKRFKLDVFKKALDYERYRLLQLLSAIEFLNNYAAKFACVIVREELGDPYAPVDKDFMSFCSEPQNIDVFASVLNLARTDIKKLEKELEKLKEISFDPENTGVVTGLGIEDDPVGLKHSDFWSAGWLIGQLYNGYIVWRYNLAEETKGKQEQQVIFLERQKAGADESELAEIQKKIDYYNNNINKLTMYMEEIEDDAGIKRK